MTDDGNAIKALGLDTARRLMQRIRRGFSQFAQELVIDLNTPGGGTERQRQQREAEIEKEKSRQEGVLSYETRRSALDRLKDQHNARVEGINRRLANGELTVTQWRGLMGIEIRALHFNGRVLSRGGIGALTQDDLDAIETQVRSQLAYLNNWAGQLETQESLSEAGLNVRGRMYTGAVSETFERGLVANQPFDLPFFPAQGTECRTNCGCNWVVVPGSLPGDYDAFWVRGKNDSCDTCLTRERVCNPLKIIQGTYNLPVNPGLYAKSWSGFLTFQTPQELEAFIDSLALGSVLYGD